MRPLHLLRRCNSPRVRSNATRRLALPPGQRTNKNATCMRINKKHASLVQADIQLKKLTLANSRASRSGSAEFYYEIKSIKQWTGVSSRKNFVLITIKKHNNNREMTNEWDKVVNWSFRLIGDWTMRYACKMIRFKRYVSFYVSATPRCC